MSVFDASMNRHFMKAYMCEVGAVGLFFHFSCSSRESLIVAGVKDNAMPRYFSMLRASRVIEIFYQRYAFRGCCFQRLLYVRASVNVIAVCRVCGAVWRAFGRVSVTIGVARMKFFVRLKLFGIVPRYGM